MVFVRCHFSFQKTQWPAMRTVPWESNILRTKDYDSVNLGIGTMKFLEYYEPVTIPWRVAIETRKKTSFDVFQLFVVPSPAETVLLFQMKFVVDLTTKTVKPGLYFRYCWWITS